MVVACPESCTSASSWSLSVSYWEHDPPPFLTSADVIFRPRQDGFVEAKTGSRKQRKERKNRAKKFKGLDKAKVLAGKVRSRSSGSRSFSSVSSPRLVSSMIVLDCSANNPA